jgi:hypothetical protein
MHRLISSLPLWCVIAATTNAAPLCLPQHPMSRADLYTEDRDEGRDDSIRKLERRAREGDALAMNSLGVRYGTGTGVQLDSRKSFGYYQAAAAKGLPLGWVNLAYMYAKGEGVERNPRLAREWLDKAVDVGHMRAQAMLGHMLGTGTDTEKNPKEAAFCYLLAARQGYRDAQYTMSILYRGNHGIPENHRESVLWRDRLRDSQGKPASWFTEEPLTEMPPSWNTPWEFVSEASPESTVWTPNYSFQVVAPTPVAMHLPWRRYVGTPDSRGTALRVSVAGDGSWGIQVVPNGTLAAGDSLSGAAHRVRPGVEFGTSPDNGDCVIQEPLKPIPLDGLDVVMGFCTHPKTREIYEIGISHRSLASGLDSNDPAADAKLLELQLKRVVKTFRFE